ncbi:selenophosphate synthase [Tumebacillus permanentifrigoris]|uniref:Selenide, water dikinase n=1 Tax=Tumebacillus permanentifrigoris TaxID=378543 RepID=A0A316D688_9BACL|nr:selenophosphate synthase [Tumebacillus permanentifrigoris]
MIVGIDTSDDAGVYKLNEETALVQTLDFFTPVVDDPYMFGAIAAANALSDVYAMGGVPLTVLNIVGFPISKLDKKILADILRGGADKVRESGAIIVGGHSIDDTDPKYGMSVTGTVHPQKVWTNAGAKPGDKLLLTKPIGVGIVTTAIKRGKASAEAIELVTQTMAELNRVAAEVAHGFTVHACTDVTGFGLAGHALEMARGAGVGIVLHVSQVPTLPETRAYVEQKIYPGGTVRNMEWVQGDVSFEGVDEDSKIILCDAVTSGGLLFSIPADQADAMVAQMQERGLAYAAVVGDVTHDHPSKIVVRP